MAIKIESGLWTTIWRKKKASTTFTANSLVSLDDGYVTPADSTTGAADEPCLGVYEGPAISASTVGTYLYTNTAEVAVQVPIGPATVRALVTGTLANTCEGLSFDLSDAVTVNKAATTYGVVTCVRYISATEGIFAISKSIYANVA
jgi:hypothetical protein